MNNTKTLPDASDIIQHIWSPKDEEVKLIREAYALAEKAHESQKRRSGRPYVNHAIQTAIILAKLSMDTKSIVAGLLHDVIEDTDTPAEEIKNQFGEEVLFLVQGVTKLGHVRYQGLKRHIESLRKLFVATSQDIRVLIIKLADRLHNMRTLQHIPERKQGRIAAETLEVYAPIARRLGIGKIYTELQDLAFPFVHPEDYQQVRELSDDKYEQSLTTIKNLRKKLLVELDAEEKIVEPTVDYRVKSIYSLYEKLKRKDMDIEQIYDIVALRVIVNSIEECYTTLGLVHSIWRPLPDRLKDYIASPKPNGYQSLHTTIFTGDGNMAEIQIRTNKMHEIAEYGVASHVRYKEDDGDENMAWFEKLTETMRSTQEADAKGSGSVPDWIKEMTDAQADATDPAEFMKNLEMDFFEDRIFVFTPKGDVIDLPAGSSPLDFAYHIHSDIGNHLSGARVNNKLASLDTKLESGDIVEIMTSRSNQPKRKWLDYVKTTMARDKITRAVRQKVRNDS